MADSVIELIQIWTRCRPHAFRGTADRILLCIGNDVRTFGLKRDLCPVCPGRNCRIKMNSRTEGGEGAKVCY